MKKIILLLLLLCFCAPAFADGEVFYTLDDKPIPYAEMTSYPKTILFVWTTWCPSCRRQLERLSLEQVFFDDINIWYISAGENKSTVTRFVNSRKLNNRIKERIVLDKNILIAQKFSISGIPTFIFLKDSKPVYKSYFLNSAILEKVFSEE